MSDTTKRKRGESPAAARARTTPLPPFDVLACLPSVAERLLADVGKLSTEAIARPKAPKPLAAMTAKRGAAGIGLTAAVEIVGLLTPDYMRHVRGRLGRLASDNAVSRVLLYVNSPGGYTTGTEELAAAVRATAAIKPVIACAEDFCASGAYWVASQATELVVSPSCQVGSIGVYLVAIDDSEFYERLGVRAVRVRTGSLKGVGTPGLKISDDEQAMLQRHVDAEFRVFQLDLLRTRRMSVKELLSRSTGETWRGSEAVSLKLADRVGLVDDVIAMLQSEESARERYRVEQGRAALEELSRLVCKVCGVDEPSDAYEDEVKKVWASHPQLAAKARAVQPTPGGRV